MRFAKVGSCREVRALMRASREDARRERWVWGGGVQLVACGGGGARCGYMMSCLASWRCSHGMECVLERPHV